MELSGKIPFWRLITLASQVEVKATDITVSARDLPKSYPDNILKIKWHQFVDFYDYSQSILNGIKLIHVVTGDDEKKIGKMKSDLAYRIWKYYSQQFLQTYETLNKINAEAGKIKTKTAKSMDEFGLLNITNFLAKSKNIPVDLIENWSLGKVLVEYKYEIYESLNSYENMKQSKKK